MLRTNRMLAAAAIALAAACGRNDADRVDNTATTTPAPEATTSASGGAVATDVGSGVDIEGLQLGRAVDANNRVANAMEDFRPNDTIYAVVETDDNEAGKQLVARWTYGDNDQLVAEQTQTVAAGSETRTVFKLSKPSGWPKGEYHVRILHNGQEVKNAEFEVK
jgi:hypothetical protein